MLGLPPSVRIYFATELTDMRNGIDGLRSLVESTLGHDAYGGHLFVFVGKAKDKVKTLLGSLRLRSLHEAPREGAIPAAR